jgi:hypothetical protein
LLRPAHRACLLALKHNNPRNASEILIDLRSNQELCKVRGVPPFMACGVRPTPLCVVLI